MFDDIACHNLVCVSSSQSHVTLQLIAFALNHLMIVSLPTEAGWRCVDLMAGWKCVKKGGTPLIQKWHAISCTLTRVRQNAISISVFHEQIFFTDALTLKIKESAGPRDTRSYMCEGPEDRLDQCPSHSNNLYCICGAGVECIPSDSE